MNWLQRIFHRCTTPERLPVTEDQRHWLCPECGTIWAWAEIPTDDVLGGVGWVKWASVG